MICFDRSGRIVEFTEHLHKFVAKAMNAIRGRWENFWSSEPPCLVRLVEPSDVIDKLVYAATNPVKDHLVARVHHWPGVNGLSALLNQRPLTIQRPHRFFRRTGPMPAEVTLALVLPPELGDGDAIRRAIRERVAAVEAEVAGQRARSGAPLLGRRAVLLQSWRGQPTTREPRRGLRPRVAARTKWARIEALQRCRDFVSDYREARGRWLRGLAAVFPIGTYWLRRFANVPIEPPTPA
jgi:putative transposase